MNQDNNINQYINTSIDTKSHTGTKLKRCSDIDEHNHVFDELHEECGVFGMYDFDGGNVASTIYYGLFALQHRGQESCGIAVSDTHGPKGKVTTHKGMGLVNEVFTPDILEPMKGDIGVGHVRYSTAGSSTRENAQPLVLNYVKGTLAMAHNGNLINAKELRKELEYTGAIFQTTIDSEVIAYHIARERLNSKTAEEAVRRACQKLKGAYALESDMTMALAPEKQARCVFEYIYFARPDSHIDGVSVYGSRIKAGRFLAMDSPVEADIVTGVPESGNAAALGYSLESGIPYGTAFVKNGYVGRTFIKPKQSSRESSVQIKLNVLKEAVKGKRVVMIDDSIVRGTTSDRIVRMLREAGATEVHVRISSPPFLWPCYFGTDIPAREQLIAYNRTIDDIRQIIGADSLGYLGIDRLHEMVEGLPICMGCFTGKYPMEPPKDDIRGEYFDKEIDLERKMLNR